MNLYIYEYNNYYNRIHKKAGDSIADYTDYLYYGPVTGVYGFTPGDGINTTQIIGTNVQPYYDGKGNYLIAHDPNSNKIDSRWFIIDHKRTRDGQWHLTLHRDLIADFYAEIIDAPMYIEKAILNDGDPLIYNNEQLNLNQIKTSQTLLKDRSNSSWLVGYLTPNETENINIAASTSYKYDQAVTNIRDWAYYKYTNGTAQLKSSLKSAYIYLDVYNLYGLTKDTYTIPVHTVPRVSYEELGHVSSGNYQYLYYSTTPDKQLIKDSLFVNSTRNLKTLEDLTRFVHDIPSKDALAEILAEQGQVIKEISTGKYYKVNIQTETETQKEEKKIVATSYYDGQFKTYLLEPSDTSGTNDYFLNKNIYQTYFGSSVEPGLRVEASYNKISVTLEEVQDSRYATTIFSSTKVAKDSPYKIFCMPYNTENKPFKFKYQNQEYEMTPGTSLAMATKIISELSGEQKLGRQKLYDLQLLPYCPVEDFYIGDDFTLDDVGEQRTKDIDFSIVNKNDTDIGGFLAFANYSNFEAFINVSISVSNVKISNECDKYRICSPNFNGAFEFNLAKNGGLNGLQISCTYKPHQPYIKVAPIFNELYGANFKDPRGLICGGEFGLPLMNDQWAAYEIQNKNYLNSFNRQIENMEIQHDIQREQEYWSIGAGAFSGVAAGALAGASVGGVPGAIVSGAAGGVASIWGGIADIGMNERLRNEAIDYTKDQFNYSLQNIQALPYTLARVSSLTNDNTIFPILEYYTCTDREKEALANKIAYNGMTVMAIGKIKDYKNNSWSYNGITSKGYIKGKLIRLDNLNEDFHMINAIGEELNKGVYIQ